MWRLRRVPRAEAGRYLWNRFSKPQGHAVDLAAVDDDQFRAAVIAGVAARHGEPDPKATPANKDVHRIEAQLAAKEAIESGFYGRAFSERFHLDLTRYEIRLERQLSRLFADLEKRQTVRARRRSENEELPARQHHPAAKQKSAKQTQFPAPPSESPILKAVAFQVDPDSSLIPQATDPVVLPPVGAL